LAAGECLFDVVHVGAGAIVAPLQSGHATKGKLRAGFVTRHALVRSCMAVDVDAASAVCARARHFTVAVAGGRVES